VIRNTYCEIAARARVSVCIHIHSRGVVNCRHVYFSLDETRKKERAFCVFRTRQRFRNKKNEKSSCERDEGFVLRESVVSSRPSMSRFLVVSADESLLTSSDRDVDQRWDPGRFDWLTAVSLRVVVGTSERKPRPVFRIHGVTATALGNLRFSSSPEQIVVYGLSSRIKRTSCTTGTLGVTTRTGRTRFVSKLVDLDRKMFIVNERVKRPTTRARVKRDGHFD